MRGRKTLRIILGVLATTFLLIGVVFFSSCGNVGTSENGSNSEQSGETGDINEKGAITSVDGATIEGTDIFMFVDYTTDSVSLLNKVTVSSGSWDLYSDIFGQNCIPTKIAAGVDGVLADGENTFYIILKDGNGDVVEVYTLTIYRSYAVTISYYSPNDICVYNEMAYTGYEYETDYVYSAEGYTFNSWLEDGTNYQPRVLWSDLSLYADMTANSYNISLNANGGSLSQAQLSVIYNAEYAFPVPEREGYTFLGWFAGETQLTDQSGQSASVWRYTDIFSVTANWRINQYTVSVLYDSEVGSVTGAGIYDYGTEITIKAESNIGYTWLGWYNLEDEFITNELNYCFVLSGDVTYNAKWIKCPITTASNNSIAGSITVPETTIAGEETTIVAKTNVGYTWVGWFQEEKLLTSDLSYTFIMPSSDNELITYTAKWIKVTLECNLMNCGSISKLNKTYTAGQVVTIEQKETFLGYTWIGWYHEDKLLTENTAYSLTMPTEDVTLTAAWSINTEICNFTFNSTTTFCSITGIIDNTVENINIPNYVTSISSEAFNFCTNLKEITIGDNVISINARTFKGCSALSNIIVSENNKYLCSVDGNLYNKDKTKLIKYATWKMPTNIVIPDEITEIGDYAFLDCNTLTSIVISDTVQKIGSAAFNGCSNLETMTLPLNFGILGYIFGRESYENSYSAYQYGGSLFGTDYYIPNGLKYINVTSGQLKQDVFNNCKSIITITLNNIGTVIPSKAFKNCASLIEVNIPQEVVEVRAMAFGGCTSLQKVIFEVSNGWQAHFHDVMTDIWYTIGELSDPEYAVSQLLKYGNCIWYRD